MSELIAIRDGFGKALVELGRKNDKVVVVSGVWVVVSSGALAVRRAAVTVFVHMGAVLPGTALVVVVVMGAVAVTAGPRRNRQEAEECRQRYRGAQPCMLHGIVMPPWFETPIPEFE